jgi:hypothetical protein
MCLTPIVDYVPRPEKPAARPAGGEPSLAEHDHNLYGPRPTPPQWHEVEIDSTAPEPTNSSTAAAVDTAAVVAAFAGLDNTLAAYNHAVEQRYRFYSYGDAMFIQ